MLRFQPSSPASPSNPSSPIYKSPPPPSVTLRSQTPPVSRSQTPLLERSNKPTPLPRRELTTSAQKENITNGSMKPLTNTWVVRKKPSLTMVGEGGAYVVRKKPSLTRIGNLSVSRSRAPLQTSFKMEEPRAEKEWVDEETEEEGEVPLAPVGREREHVVPPRTLSRRHQRQPVRAGQLQQEGGLGAFERLERLLASRPSTPPTPKEEESKSRRGVVKKKSSNLSNANRSKALYKPTTEPSRRIVRKKSSHLSNADPIRNSLPSSEPEWEFTPPSNKNKAKGVVKKKSSGMLRNHEGRPVFAARQSSLVVRTNKEFHSMGRDSVTSTYSWARRRPSVAASSVVSAATGSASVWGGGGSASVVSVGPGGGRGRTPQAPLAQQQIQDPQVNSLQRRTSSRPPSVTPITTTSTSATTTMHAQPTMKTSPMTPASSGNPPRKASLAHDFKPNSPNRSTPARLNSPSKNISRSEGGQRIWSPAPPVSPQHLSPGTPIYGNANSNASGRRPSALRSTIEEALRDLELAIENSPTTPSMEDKKRGAGGGFGAWGDPQAERHGAEIGRSPATVLVQETLEQMSALLPPPQPTMHVKPSPTPAHHSAAVLPLKRTSTTTPPPLPQLSMSGLAHLQSQQGVLHPYADLFFPSPTLNPEESPLNVFPLFDGSPTAAASSYFAGPGASTATSNLLVSETAVSSTNNNNSNHISIPEETANASIPTPSSTLSSPSFPSQASLYSSNIPSNTSTALSSQHALLMKSLLASPPLSPTRSLDQEASTTPVSDANNYSSSSSVRLSEWVAGSATENRGSSFFKPMETDERERNALMGAFSPESLSTASSLHSSSAEMEFLDLEVPAQAMPDSLAAIRQPRPMHAMDDTTTSLTSASASSLTSSVLGEPASTMSSPSSSTFSTPVGSPQRHNSGSSNSGNSNSGNSTNSMTNNLPHFRNQSKALDSAVLDASTASNMNHISTHIHRNPLPSPHSTASPVDERDIYNALLPFLVFKTQNLSLLTGGSQPSGSTNSGAPPSIHLNAPATVCPREIMTPPPAPPTSTSALSDQRLCMSGLDTRGGRTRPRSVSLPSLSVMQSLMGTNNSTLVDPSSSTASRKAADWIALKRSVKQRYAGTWNSGDQSSTIDVGSDKLGRRKRGGAAASSAPGGVLGVLYEEEEEEAEAAVDGFEEYDESSEGDYVDNEDDDEEEADYYEQEVRRLSKRLKLVSGSYSGGSGGGSVGGHRRNSMPALSGMRSSSPPRNLLFGHIDSNSANKNSNNDLMDRDGSPSSSDCNDPNYTDPSDPDFPHPTPPTHKQKLLTPIRALPKHPTDNLFHCPYSSCPRSFTRRFNLQAHYATHLQLREFGCPVCGRGFSRRYDMKRHVRTHRESGVGEKALEMLEREEREMRGGGRGRGAERGRVRRRLRRSSREELGTLMEEEEEEEDFEEDEMMGVEMFEGEGEEHMAIAGNEGEKRAADVESSESNVKRRLRTHSSSSLVCAREESNSDDLADATPAVEPKVKAVKTKKGLSALAQDAVVPTLSARIAPLAVTKPTKSSVGKKSSATGLKTVTATPPTTAVPPPPAPLVTAEEISKRLGVLDAISDSIQALLSPIPPKPKKKHRKKRKHDKDTVLPPLLSSEATTAVSEATTAKSASEDVIASSAEPAVPKRRGRPPGRKNNSTLIRLQEATHKLMETGMDPVEAALKALGGPENRRKGGKKRKAGDSGEKEEGWDGRLEGESDEGGKEDEENADGMADVVVLVDTEEIAMAS
ncbi:hypothetical protein HDV05_008288 [Chytridiales sp. JEL 0842]|nr:hypothetical protein HDV05_008288 [Chytridiales sp. JEL 0842]